MSEIRPIVYVTTDAVDFSDTRYRITAEELKCFVAEVDRLPGEPPFEVLLNRNKR